MEHKIDAKQKFWQAIEAQGFNGYRFNQHVLVEPFIVDFACLDNKVIVEVDETTCKNGSVVDQHRTDYLTKQGYHVVRFYREDVTSDISSVISQLHSQLHS